MSKYVATFDYIDKVLIVLSATSDGVSITCFTIAIGAPAGKESAYFNLFFNYRNN